MSEKQESSASSLKKSTGSSVGDDLEGASGVGVRMRKKKTKKRVKKSSKANSTSRKDDVPACETVEKVSAKTANETSQSEWLDEIVSGGAAPPESRWKSILGFMDQYKYPLMASVALAGVLVYFSVRKTSKFGGSKCPFTI